MINQMFVEEDGEDLDRIDVITSTNSSTSLSANSINSHHQLTSVKVNYGRQESIELSNALSSTIASGVGFRVSTPINMVRRWSQSISRFSKDKRTIRENTINRLPSRKVFEVDGKLLSATGDAEAEIEQLVKEIEQHETLMKDTALGEQNRLETLRALPQPLATKLLLKQKLSLTIEQQSNDGPWHKRFFNYCIAVLLKLWKYLGILCDGVEIWYDALKIIEGHFGSNVSSYFKFLRWLFVLNTLVCVCTVGFITLPQVLYGTTPNDTNEFNDFAVLKRELSVDVNVNGVVEQSADFSVLDLFTGEGYLKSSLLFYGHYRNDTFTFGNSQRSYSIPHAYYMTMLILYLFTFVLISTSMARSYRKSFIETSGGIRAMNSHKLFCSWDYGISISKAAELKHFAIYTELKEMLTELGESKLRLPILWRVWIICSQLVAHLLVGAMIAGLGVAIWILLKEFGGKYEETSFWTTLYVPTVINFSVLLLQSVFSWIARLEDCRSPRRALHVSLVRNFLLEAVIIGILVYFWLTTKYNEGGAALSSTNSCWETAIGQEIYRLIVSEFFISLLVVPLIYAMRVLLTNFFPKFGYPEFDISQQSLGLVFNQTLLWVGLFFAPLLALVMLLKLVIMFYVKKAILLHLCKSPRQIWRSAQTQTLYLVFTFLSLLGVIIALGYIMTQVPVSSHCGPFRDYAFMFQIFIDGVLKLRQNQTVWRILMTLIRPAVVGGMLILMAIMAYYLRAKSRAHCAMVKLLKEMLYLEAKDKEFLLSNITNIKKDREWTFDQVEEEHDEAAADRFAESSGTWRYGRSISHTLNAGAPSTSSSEECVLRSRNV